MRTQDEDRPSLSAYPDPEPPPGLPGSVDDGDGVGVVVGDAVGVGDGGGTVGVGSTPTPVPMTTVGETLDCPTPLAARMLKAYDPGVVGVPDSRPAASRVSPGGRVPPTVSVGVGTPLTTNGKE